MRPREPADRERGRDPDRDRGRDRDRGEPERHARTGAPVERIARLAADYVAEMTGKEPEGVTALERADDGDWVVGVEVVEIHRIPESTDVLAVYEAELDPDGELVAYRRVKRYARCQVGDS